MRTRARRGAAPSRSPLDNHDLAPDRGSRDGRRRVRCEQRVRLARPGRHLTRLLSLFAVATVWGLSAEIGIERSSVVRCGLYAALVLLVTVGLSDVHPVYGLLVGVAVGLSSPTAMRLLAPPASDREGRGR